MCEYEKRNYEKVQDDAKRVVAEFLEQAKLKKGDLVVIGCSTSEIAEHHIGSYSNAALGEAVFTAMDGGKGQVNVHSYVRGTPKGRSDCGRAVL